MHQLTDSECRYGYGDPYFQCTIHIYQKKFQSLDNLRGCQVSKALIQTIAEISDKKVTKQTEEIKALHGDIKSLADEYVKLESRTKDCVLEVKCYGENLKQCAEDFIEDGILKDYKQGLADMDTVKEELQKVAEQHIAIDVKVKIITKRAEGNAKIMTERREEIEETEQSLTNSLKITEINRLE